jgi:hypothetical protein
MKTRKELKQIRQIVPQLTILGSFVLVLGIFGGYAYFLKAKEHRDRELFLGELRYLRQENHSFAERIQELELQCGAASTEEGISSNSLSTEENLPEAAPATERSFVYHVKRGDTIWDIAAIYQVDVESLMRWNNLTSRSRIFPGDQLTIILEE